MTQSEGTPALAPVEQNPVLLTYCDASLERQFNDASARSYGREYRRMTIGWLLVWLAFIPFDIILEHRYTLVWIRLVLATPALLAAVVLGFQPFARFARYWQMTLAAGFIATSLTASVMTVLVNGSSRIKDLVIGQCLIIVLSHTALMLRFPTAMVANAISFVGFAVAIGFTEVNGLEQATNLTWVFGASGIGVIGSRLLERHRRNEFLQARQLEAERAETRRLLLNVLPEPIAHRLQHEKSAIADTFSDVTVLFGDLVGFTALSASMSPEALVRALDEVFTAFDELAERHGLEKIKTIGDAYMVVGGVPVPRAGHAEAIAQMAIEMLEVVQRFRFGDGSRLEMRIGIHSGPVVAGVIGKKKFIYDLWGDTVNTASRLESHGVPGAIHVSEAVYARLKDSFEFEARGEVELKGKGRVPTWFLRRSRT